MSKIAQPIQAMCFNAELHTLYNSCVGLARGFLESINTVTVDVLSKHCMTRS